MPLDYKDKEVERLLQQMYRTGFTQAGVNEVYQRLGLANPPTVPASLVGAHPGAGRGASLITGADGRTRTRTREEADFFNLFARQSQDPYREYGVGNYLGLAGLIAGGAMATGPQGAGLWGNSGAAAGTAGATSASGSSGLGVFANGGVNGLAGVGAGNAGALAASGGIAGGAGIGGTIGGALGGASGLANAVSGVGSGGNGMGWDWGNIVDLGGSLLGGWLEADGAKDAARASAAGSAAALAENRRQYDTTRADMMPWLEAGRGALGRLQDPQANFTTSPGYEFVRGEGMRGIENSFAARGGAASGNALRRLAEFNAGVASGEYNNWWNQQAGLAGIGQTSAQNLGAFGANSAANAGNLLQNQANARASGVEGRTNAYTGVLQNLLAFRNRNKQPVY